LIAGIFSDIIKNLREKHLKWVRLLQLFFYVAFVVLWFKDNFAPLRKLPAVSLLAAGSPASRFLILLFILAGFVYLTAVSLKKRAILPPAAFCLFSFLFFLLYLFSYFGTKSAVRYFYPLYISLPVLFLAMSLVFKSRVRNVLPFGLVALLFIFFNMRPSLSQYETIKDRHVRIARAAGAMQKTGQRYWCAEYWTAYLLTAVSGEKLVVNALTHDRYPPYTLAYWNRTEKDNFVFFLKETPGEEARYSNIVGWLAAFGIPAKKENLEDGRLLYDLDSRFYPESQFREIPPQYPHLEIDTLYTTGGYLFMIFFLPRRRSPADFRPFGASLRPNDPSLLVSNSS